MACGQGKSVIFLSFIVFVLSTFVAPTEANYRQEQKPDETSFYERESFWRAIFGFLGLIVIVKFYIDCGRACYRQCCAFPNGIDKHFAEPVVYVGHGVYIPQKLVAQRLNIEQMDGAVAIPMNDPDPPGREPYRIKSTTAGL